MTAPALKDFAGDWRMARQIEDFAAARRGSLQGRALFRWQDGALLCHETGVMSFEGQPPLSAERQTLWRDENGLIAVDYADGRPFHRFDPCLPRAEALHDCPPDLYRVRYDFTAWPVWTARWRVTGPRKDYEMRTEYRPDT